MFGDLLKRIKADTLYRTKICLCASFIFNCIYSVFLLIIGHVYQARYFLVTAVYYGLLSVARVLMFLKIIRQRKYASQIATLRLCGCFLLVINLIFSTMVFLLLDNKFAKQHEIVVIALATYTFSSLAVAVINCVKYLRKKDPLYSSVKLISLVSASISLVMLTNTMLATFGASNYLLKSIVLPMLSVAVSIFITIYAILMIYKTNVELWELKNEED